MKTVMMLPPTSVVGIAAGALRLAGQLAGSVIPALNQWSIFIDLQAEVIELDMKRYLVEHQVPGREGGILQDLGSASSKILVKGKWIYENKPDKDILDIMSVLPNVGWNWIRVQSMQLIYRMKQPIVFVSDLIATTAMIEALRFRKVGGHPNVFEYSMVLKEFNPMLTVAGIIGSGVGTILPVIGLGDLGY